MSLTDKVLDATSGRDRVVDAAKTVALLLVVLGHSLAWTVTDEGTVTNTLEAAPQLYPLTWILQILPIFFFLAGHGMARYARTPSAASLLRRTERLVTPCVLLYLTGLILTTTLSATIGGPTASAAGILPTQLTWFIGVYLIVLAISPLLARLDKPWQPIALLAAIGAVDLLRVNVNSGIGWANMVLVWSYFATLGMSLERWKRLPRPLLLAGAVLSAALAGIAVWAGPYSAALITTQALPGLSNLAPPTIVLALAGTAQICLLLFAWDTLERILRNNRLWVPIAVFASKAMGIYLWHMVILSSLIGIVLLTGSAPTPLGALWWAEHAAVLAVLAATVWLIATPLLNLSRRLNLATQRILPRSIADLAVNAPTHTVAACAILLGAGMLLASEAGISEPLTLRSVLGVPYLPIALIAALVLYSAIAAKAAAADKTP